MFELLTQTLKEIVSQFQSQGVRFVRIKAIALAIRAVQTLRALILLNYVILFVCFLCSNSFFFTVYLIAQQIQDTRSVFLTIPLGLCGSLFALTAALLAFSVREKNWLKWLHVEGWIDTAFGRPEPTRDTEIDAEALARMIERIIDEKLSKTIEKETP